jgi:hypothetical protein
MLQHVVSLKYTDVSDVLTAFVFRAMNRSHHTDEVVSTSETINFYQTAWYNYQKTVIFILATVRSWNLTQHNVWWLGLKLRTFESLTIQKMIIVV